MSTCGTDGCTRPPWSYGYCSPCRREGLARCLVGGCQRDQYSLGFCSPHYRRVLRYGDPGTVEIGVRRRCTVKDCIKKYSCHGFCDMHYRRWRLHGDPSVTLPRGRPRKDRQYVPVLPAA